MSYCDRYNNTFIQDYNYHCFYCILIIIYYINNYKNRSISNEDNNFLMKIDQFQMKIIIFSKMENISFLMVEIFNFFYLI